MAGFTAADAARWVSRAIGRPVDVVIANTGRPSNEALLRYAAEQKVPLELGDARRAHRAGDRAVLDHRDRAPRPAPAVVRGVVGAESAAAAEPAARCDASAGANLGCPVGSAASSPWRSRAESDRDRSDRVLSRMSVASAACRARIASLLRAAGSFALGADGLGTCSRFTAGLAAGPAVDAARGAVRSATTLVTPWHAPARLPRLPTCRPCRRHADKRRHTQWGISGRGDRQRGAEGLARRASRLGTP